MRTGLEVFGDIDGAVTVLREELAQTQRRIEELEEQEETLRREERALLQTLAQIRTEALLSGDIEATQREIVALLEERRKMRQKTQAERDALAEQLHEAEEKRRTIHEQLYAAGERLMQARQAWQEALENEPRYQHLLASVTQAKHKAQAAAKQAEEARRKQEKKAEPYRSDPLFSYLWDRGYGTPTYRESGWVRMLDGWTAKVAGYEANRRNYALLLQSTRLYETHAARQQEAYEAKRRELEEIRKAKADAWSIDRLIDEEASLRKELEAQDAHIEALEQKRMQTDRALQAYASAQDTYTQRIEALYAELLGGKDILTLAETAAQTATSEDDRLLHRLQRLRQERNAVEERRRTLRETLETKRLRLEELERTRSELKRRRYDDYRMGYDRNVDIGGVLGDILGGVVQSGVLLDTLAKAGRVRYDMPDIGWGGDVFTPSQDHSFPDAGDLFSFPGSGEFDEGGFRTGGGF